MTAKRTDANQGRKLKPPKRYREVMPRCCATCAHHRYDRGTTFCERDPDGTFWDSGDMDDVIHVCDYWRSYRT
jgi:hypothetical protein